jgi:hypothetical protein
LFEVVLQQNLGEAIPLPHLMFQLYRIPNRKFRKVAEAIESATLKGYTSIWNKKWKNVPFDAVMVLNKPPVNYAIVIRFVSGTQLIRKEVVSKFANDARKVGAQIGLIFSEAGFLDECSQVYDETGLVRLFELETVNRVGEQELKKVFELILNEYNFRFRTLNGTEFLIPDEPGVLKSFLQQAKILGPTSVISPESLLLRERENVYRNASAIHQQHHIDLPAGSVFLHPNTLEQTPVIQFAYDYGLFLAAEMEEPPTNSPYIIDKIFGEELQKRNPNVSPAATGEYQTDIRPLTYYYNPNLLFSYYCEEVSKEFALLVLIESTQNGGFFQARIRFRLASAMSQLVEITTEEEITRLSVLYERFLVSNRNLTGRFEAFIKSLEHVECIDLLELTQKQQDANKADYFLHGRQVICEQKSLVSDRTFKAEEILNTYKHRPEWPIFFGRNSSARILERFPDKDEINQKLLDAVSKRIEDDIKLANRQLRSTKETFELPKAAGLVVILNELVFSLKPNVIAFRVRKALQKKTREGKPRFPDISAVLVIHTAHRITIHDQLDALPILSIKNEYASQPIEQSIVTELVKEWSHFEGIPILEADLMPDNIRFRNNKDERARKK